MENMGEIAGEQDHISSPTSADPLMTAHDLSPLASRQQATVTVASVLDSHEIRSHLPDATYQTLNGRASPTIGPYPTQYNTLTTLQPLPPISTVSDKFGNPQHPNISAGFSLMQNNNFPIEANNYRYNEKIGFGNSSPMHYGGMMMNSYNQAALGYPNYNNGLASPKHDPKLMSPTSPYGEYPVRMARSLQSPTPMLSGNMNSIHITQSPIQQVHMQTRSGERHLEAVKSEPMEEINTKELAQKISSELKRYSIPQAVFAQRVLCRSQGTLSDLLRNPKPWSKLKSGRETFRRMWKWLQEPEYQRMAALRIAGKYGSGSVTYSNGNSV